VVVGAVTQNGPENCERASARFVVAITFVFQRW
jgi:hypothetical protein